jgi:hypothetical protein
VRNVGRRGVIQAQRRHARTATDPRHAFSGQGIQDNLADKAKMPRYRCSEIRQRMGVALHPSDATRAEVHRRSAPFRLHLFCWLIFTLTVYALPFFVAINAGIWAFHNGGLLGTPLVAVAAGIRVNHAGFAG